ncbi:hypothetical protein ACQB60_44260 [Actinomycetota bacterium Odt1-20B]
MTRTTPPRPLDVEALFPELAAHRRTATRLHPRPGAPGVHDSSVGGPFLWPADEPWPTCTEPHERGRGLRTEDIRRSRRILDEAWRRDADPGPTQDERQLLQDLEKKARHAPRDPSGTTPVPLLALAQLHRRDLPDLAAGPDGADLLQILWCPFDRHGEGGYGMSVRFVWRRAEDVGEVLADQPEPEVVGFEGYVPQACVLHPEQVTEYEYGELLPEELLERIEEWEGDDDEGEGEGVDGGEGEGGGPGCDYQSDLSIAPGWKVGGFAPWNVTGPGTMTCACGQPMHPLLTIASSEWDGGNRSWVPVEDRHLIGEHGSSTPTKVTVSRWGRLNVFACPVDPAHPPRISLQ